MAPSEAPLQTNSDPGPKRVLIVGAGFGGLSAARRLVHNKDVHVTILDKHNYHLFQPLLYQVAMAGLSPSDIAVPVRTVLSRKENAETLLAEVKSIDLPARQVTTDFGRLNFDYLILACGSQQSYFGHEQWEPDAPGLKTLEQATEVRRRVLLSFELAERETDPEKIKRLLTFIVVGGGPTGVELAGSLGEISRYALKRDFRHIDPGRTRIVLIEAGPRILSTFDPSLSQRAVRDLESLGVTVRTNARVTNVTRDGVQLDSEMLYAATAIWAAGVKPSPINAHLGAPLDRAGRVIVQPDLSLPNQPNVFVIGDQANFSHTPNGKPLPGVAPVAMQEGHHVADMINADIEGSRRTPFHYRDKGQLATIGRRKAVVEIGNLKFGGFIAWWIWLIVHIFYLIGFRNRVLVLIQWAWSYFTFRRSAQLIIDKNWRSF